MQTELTREPAPKSSNWDLWASQKLPCVSLPRSNHSSDFYEHRLVLPPFEVCTNGIIEYVLFVCVWLFFFLLYIMFLRLSLLLPVAVTIFWCQIHPVSFGINYLERLIETLNYSLGDLLNKPHPLVSVKIIHSWRICSGI